MIRLTFAPTTRSDAEFVAHNLRDSDRIELALSSGNPTGAVVRAAVQSEYAWTGYEGHLPVCVFGVTGVHGMPTFGSPWMVGTPALMKHRKQILVDGRRYVRIMLQLYPRLGNFVHVDNHSSIVWLRAMGFTVSNLAIPYGVARAPFLPFSLTSDV